MIWRFLHRLGFHRNEIINVHVTPRNHIIYETKCRMCGKRETHYD